MERLFPAAKESFPIVIFGCGQQTEISIQNESGRSSANRRRTPDDGINLRVNRANSYIAMAGAHQI